MSTSTASERAGDAWEEPPNVWLNLAGERVNMQGTPCGESFAPASEWVETTPELLNGAYTVRWARQYINSRLTPDWTPWHWTPDGQKTTCGIRVHSLGDGKTYDLETAAGREAVNCQRCLVRLDAKVCTVEGCDRLATTRGWCTMHYNRHYTTGSLLGRAKPVTDPLERFWEYVDKSGECWTWTGHRSKHGYGRFWPAGHRQASMTLAHRWIYERTVGPIPDGMHLHHVCKTRSCVRVDHLKPLDAHEHARESAVTVGGVIRNEAQLEAALLRKCRVGRVELAFAAALVERIRELEAQLEEGRRLQAAEVGRVQRDNAIALRRPVA